MQTHRCKHIYKPPQANPQSKVCKRASTSPAQEKLFFKISLPSKNFKTATAHPDKKTLGQMVAKLNIDKGFETRTTRIASCQHCIRAIAGEVVNSRLVHLINFGGGGQVIALKSATALILDRCMPFEKKQIE
jgi:hypothetical protein